MSFGILYEQMGRDQKAIAAYRTAIRVQDDVTGPRTNLAAFADLSRL